MKSAMWASLLLLSYTSMMHTGGAPAFSFLTRLCKLTPSPIFHSFILYYISFKTKLCSKPYFIFYIKKLGGHVCHSTCVENRGQLTGIGFHLLPLHPENWTWVKLRSWDLETLICWAFWLALFYPFHMYPLFYCILNLLLTLSSLRRL